LKLKGAYLAPGNVWKLTPEMPVRAS
jgi:hypothetical protein